MIKTLQRALLITAILFILCFAATPAFAAENSGEIEMKASPGTQQEIKKATDAQSKTETSSKETVNNKVSEITTNGASQQQESQSIEFTIPNTQEAQQKGSTPTETKVDVKTDTSATVVVVEDVNSEKEAEVTASTSNDIAMKTTPVKNGWMKENNQTHCYKNSQIQTGWVVNDSYKNYGLQRYWTGAYGNLVSGGKIVKTDVNGTLTYCSNAGYVARNKFKETNGNFYLADNGGALETASGWLVTGKYDGGTTQRYYLDGSTHTVRLGYFTIDGKLYHALENEGYVVRNISEWRDSKWYWVDNDGVYNYLASGKIGWQNPSGYPQVSAYTVTLPSYCTGEFTYVSPSKIRPEASREDCINAFIQRAYEYIGTQYIEPWSTAPGGAVDCSGLVLQCLYATGMDLGVYNPYNHRWQAWQTYNSMNWLNNGTFMGVSTNDLQRGDLVYYSGHVAIYIGGGNIIDSWPGQGVGIHGLYSRGNLIGAQRPFV